MSNIKKWCEAILQVDTDKMSIISVRNIQLIKQEFEHLQKENDFMKKDMLESLRVNSEQSKQIEELKAENARMQKVIDIVNDRPDL